ncbi:MAG TPA: 3-deoxy-7-phosphoheptulonate synthase [Polyangiales bacterium]|nr:3-deoxy-7-phosphoheptulonate synthase [Polyangiales bacterium]
MHQTQDLRVDTIMPLASPQQIKSELPISEVAAAHVSQARAEIEAILARRDDRLLVIVGPCSIHDPEAAKQYAAQLQPLRQRHAGELFICMRGYFEKPRTTVGWKGLINDPHLDGSCDVRHGLRVARKLLLELAEAGMPTANEALDPIMPQYLADLIAWSAIGARTTESQTHREMASGLSMPVGFKNGTDGGLDVVINAMKAARAPHSFIGIDASGVVSLVRTRGNPHAHAVLRGGKSGPNYGAREVNAAARQLAAAGLNSRVLIDCSHDNSQKNHENQPLVARDVASQLASGSGDILGVMLESHLVAGRQDLVPGQALVFGQSITDACIDLTSTAAVLEELSHAVVQGRSGTRAEAVGSGPAVV